MRLTKSHAFNAFAMLGTGASLNLLLRTPWTSAHASTYAGMFAFSSVVLGAGLVAQSARSARKVVQLRFDDAGIWMNEVLVARRQIGFEGESEFEALVLDDPQAAMIVSAVSLPLRRTTFRGASPIARRWIRIAVAALSVIGVAVLVALGLRLSPFSNGKTVVAAILAIQAAFVVAFVGRIQASIDVGVDGVLRSWLWWKEFVPLRAMREARVGRDDELDVHLESGSRVKIVFARGTNELPGSERRNRDAALLRLNTSLETNRRYSSPAWLVNHLGRRGRDRHQWVRDLADARATASDYRASAIRDEDLWRILEDPLAPEDARAGAAVALRRSDDVRAAARLRIAAEAIASPRLRVTLEASAREDVTDDALAQILDAFEAKQPRR